MAGADDTATLKILVEIRQALESLGEFEAKYGASMKTATAETETTEAAVAGLGNAFSVMSGAIAAIGGAIAALKIRDFFAAALTEAGQAETALSEVESIVRATGGAAKLTVPELRDLAKELSAISVYDDDEILAKTTATLLRFGTLSGDTFKRAQKDAVDLAAALHTDLAEAALALGKALLSPGEGLRVLKEAGVDFTDEQVKMLQAMVDSGRVAEAQTIILAKLEGKYRDFANDARKTLEGANAVLKRDLGEIEQAFGEGFSDEVRQGIDAVSGGLERSEEAARGAGVAIGAMAGAITPLLPLFSKFVAIQAGFWSPVLKGASQAVAGLYGFADAFARVVQKVAELGSKLPGAGGLFGNIAEIAKDTADGIEKDGARMVNALRKSAAEMAKASDALWNGTTGTGPKRAKEDLGAIPPLLDQIPAKAEKAGKAITDHISKAASEAKRIIEQIAPSGGFFGATQEGADQLAQRKATLEREVSDLEGKAVQDPEDVSRLSQAKAELADVSQQLANAQHDLAQSTIEVADAAQQSLDPLEQGAKLLQQMRDAGLPLPGALDGATSSLAAAAEAAKAARDPMREVAGSMDNLDKATETLDASLLKNSQTVNKLGKEIGDEAIPALEGLRDRQQEGIDVAVGQAAAIDKTTAAVEKLKETDPAGYWGAVVKAQERSLELTKLINRELEKTRDLAKEIAAALQADEAAA